MTNMNGAVQVARRTSCRFFPSHQSHAATNVSGWAAIELGGVAHRRQDLFRSRSCVGGLHVLDLRLLGKPGHKLTPTPQKGDCEP